MLSVGNQTRIEEEVSFPSDSLDRDKRKLMAIVGVGVLSYLIHKMTFVIPRIDVISGGFCLIDRMPSENTVFKLFAAAVV
jgi:hypothetical protein